MLRKLWKPVLAILVIVATTIAFIDFFLTHPAVRTQLSHTSPWLVLLLLICFTLGAGCLVLGLNATLQLCGIEVKRKERWLLTLYSSVINFFGPLQSGPGFRVIYLKARYSVDLKKFALASLLYYALYAGFNCLLLVSGIVKWWLIPLALVGLGTGFIALRGHLPVLRRFKVLRLQALYLLAFATFLQVVVLTFIFYLELRAVNPGVTFGQATIYAGAANLALFVAITPGAIGFRESFLLFSQRLHHISSSSIVAANLIDRTVYVLFLVLVALIIFGTHAADRFKATSAK